jgi:hypothetical protein
MYLAEVHHPSGIFAKVVLASVSPEGKELWTLETSSPKMLDAECLTAGTLLHFERQAKPEQQCLAVMSIEEFYKKWTYGIEKKKALLQVNIDLSLIDPVRIYTYVELNNIFNKYHYFIQRFVNEHDDFPGVSGAVLGSSFIEWVNTKRNQYHIVVNTHKNILAKMRLRCYDFDTGEYTTTNIVDIWSTGVKKILRIVAGDNEIRCSENHLFLTQRGWVAAKDLIICNDQVVQISHHGVASPPKNYLSFNRSIKPILLEEQGYKCADCGCDADLSSDVHHIVPVLKDPELAFEKSNVVVLCRECHAKRHADLGKSSLSPKLYGIASIDYDGEEETYDIQVAHKDSNFVANGFVVHNCEKHRMISTNSSSSRAIPYKKLDFVYIPPDIRQKQSGMQGKEPVSNDTYIDFRATILGIYDYTHMMMSEFKDLVHKQHLNRYVEPWTMQKKVWTATEWNNFFTLRLADGADPNIRILAECMRDAMSQVTPKLLNPGEWHLPYVYDEERDQYEVDELRKISAGRCARVSYDNIHSEKPPQQLAITLLESRHLSVFEHQATPIKHGLYGDLDWRDYCEPGVTHMDRNGNLWSGNLMGFLQYRQMVSVWNNNE